METKELNESASLEKIRDAYYPILVVPFFGIPITVMVRELNDAQTKTCGDFSLIETLEDKMHMKSKNIKIRDVISYAERNYAIVKESLVKPTLEQIFKIIGADPQVEEKKKKIKELKELLTQVKPGPKRSVIEEELDNLRIKCHYLLPDDFVSWIVCYALNIDKSDIKKVSKKMLLDAAILAKNGNDNPADHLKGKFTDFMIDDINRRAWIIYNEWMKEHKGK